MNKKVIPLLILIIFVSQFSTLTFIPKVKAQGWLTGWQYRKSHTINGTTAGAQTNYTVLIIVHYESGTDYNNNTDVPPVGHVYVGGKSRADFQDIRFTASDGITLLDYWFENEETAESDGYGVFWVEIPSIPASPDTTTIYIYYGNPSASTTSDGEATFILFDHFDDGVIDLTKWEIGGQGAYTISEYDSVILIKTDESTTSVGAWVGSKNVLPVPVSVEFYARRENISGGFSWLGMTTPPIAYRYYSVLRQTIGARVQYDKAYVQYTSADGSHYEIASWGVPKDTEWHRVAVMRTGTNDTFKFDNLVATGQYPTSIDRVIEMAVWYTNYPALYVDWCFARNYILPEPSHGAWGSEEKGPVIRSVSQDLIINTVPTREATYGRTVPHQLNILAVATRLGSFARTVTQIIQFLTSAFRAVFMFRVANQLLAIFADVSREHTHNRPVSQPLNIFASIAKYVSYHRDAYHRLSILVSVSRQTSYNRAINQQLEIMTEIARHSSYYRVASQPLNIIHKTALSFSVSQKLMILIDVSRQASMSRTVSQPLQILVTAIRHASYYRTAELILRIQTSYSMKFIIYIEKPVPTPAPAPALPRISLDAIIQTAHIINTWWTRTFTIEVLVINKGTVASDVTFEYILLDSNNQIVAKGTQTVFVSGLDEKTVYVQIPKPPDGNYTMIVRAIKPVRVEARGTITVETPFYGRLSFTILLLIFIAVLAYAIKLRKR